MNAGIDLKMNPYKVLATNDQVGFIQVVENSATMSSIHKEKGTLGSLDDTSISDFLKKYNPEKKDFDKAKDNFLRSCAGYCVATYIMGIGDRHSGNIMITKSGVLFHIDFGHILGNFKTKLGIKRGNFHNY